MNGQTLPIRRAGRFSRKPRSDQGSKLDTLNARQRRQLHRRLIVENISCRECVQWVAEKFGLHTSTAAVSKYCTRISQPRPVRPSARVCLDLHIARVGKGWRFTLMQKLPGMAARLEGKELRWAQPQHRQAK